MRDDWVIADLNQKGEGKKKDDIKKFGEVMEQIQERYSLIMKTSCEDDQLKFRQLNDIVYSTTHINPSLRPNAPTLLRSLLPLRS